ncbi:MAG: hypothetical protein ACRCWB_11810 [Enterovibrio sp.]
MAKLYFMNTAHDGLQLFSQASKKLIMDRSGLGVIGDLLRGDGLAFFACEATIETAAELLKNLVGRATKETKYNRVLSDAIAKVKREMYNLENIGVVSAELVCGFDSVRKYVYEIDSDVIERAKTAVAMIEDGYTVRITCSCSNIENLIDAVLSEIDRLGRDYSFCDNDLDARYIEIGMGKLLCAYKTLVMEKCRLTKEIRQLTAQAYKAGENTETAKPQTWGYEACNF